MKVPVLIVLALTATLAAGSSYRYRHDIRDAVQKWERGSVPAALTYSQAVNSAQQTPPAANTNTAKPPAKKPATTDINLKVPFILQAPFQIWDVIHEDACEEASLAMVNLYYKGVSGPLTKEEMDKNILEIVDWENKNLGRNKDTSAADTARIMRELYGLKAQVVPISSMEDIKKVVSKGKPVIIPAYGRALKNPNFRQGGPLYHMLVIKGFTGSKVISNDPGTRNGADYLYDAKLLWGAIHDWNDGNVTQGEKVMIVVE